MVYAPRSGIQVVTTETKQRVRFFTTLSYEIVSSSHETEESRTHLAYRDVEWWLVSEIDLERIIAVVTKAETNHAAGQRPLCDRSLEQWHLPMIAISRPFLTDIADLLAPFTVAFDLDFLLLLTVTAHEPEGRVSIAQ